MLGSDSQFSSTFVERFWHNPNNGPYPSDRALFNSCFFPFSLWVRTFTAGDAVNAGVDRKSGREEAEAYLGGAKSNKFCLMMIPLVPPWAPLQNSDAEAVALMAPGGGVTRHGTILGGPGWARLSIKWVCHLLDISETIWRFPQQCGYFMVPPNHPSQIH